MTEALGVPEEFFAHHGNLSREYREYAERRMKDTSRPASIICIMTLELGIDVGDIEAVAQLGPGHTVSGMRQRLGRSGRRPGQSAVMRVYIKETELTADSHPLEALCAQTVQTIAMLNLMLRKWNEPPQPGRLHLSTLLHQIMALISQHGGITVPKAWDILIRGGKSTGVDLALFKKLLLRMGNPEVGLPEQAKDGILLPGSTGQRLLESRDIFVVFMTPGDYKVIAEGGRAIGQVPWHQLVLARSTAHPRGTPIAHRGGGYAAARAVGKAFKGRFTANLRRRAPAASRRRCRGNASRLGGPFDPGLARLCLQAAPGGGTADL
jgi:ATP-dependent helicase Lhr and Lhr-like helicase